MTEKKSGMSLPRVAFYGRTLEEYLLFYDLDLDQWKDKRILDCGAGSSSFVSEAYRQGFYVVGCDPMYDQNSESVISRIQSDMELVFTRVENNKDMFHWGFYEDMESLKHYILKAMNGFANDFTDGQAEKRYVYGGLPELPFESRSFDLALCGHFLFLYRDFFDYSFYLKSLLELIRVVTEEVRIYPITELSGRRYELLDRLLSELRDYGVMSEIRPVAFEFQLGAQEMLCLKKS